MKRWIKFLTVPALFAAAAACKETGAPAGPTAPIVVSPARVVSITVAGSGQLYERGQTQQLRAMATLTNGFIEDRSGSAQWSSDNAGVATVSPSGVVTAGNEGEASISATLDGQRGVMPVRVRYAFRTPNPAPGTRLPLPGNVAALVAQFAAEPGAPDLRTQSCPRGIKYVNNPWQDYIVDRLRTVDLRWGYNAKPTRSASDNEGVPVVAAGDEIAYNYTDGPDEGSTGVYLIDILEGHCGATPRLTYRHFTGEEPGRWTGAGRF